MYLKNYLLRLAFILPASLLLLGWGYTGHYKISYESSLSFPPEMAEFMQWNSVLAAHASDADERKDIDPDEGPRHYIDIDNYPEFIAYGQIPQEYDTVVARYGLPFVTSQGVLPWATKRTYDSLVASFRRYDFEKAVLFASDLGHYVADGHMPLHITRNYNGQYTNQYGIHSRFESSMINSFIGQITYSGDGVSEVPDVLDYIFDYLYESYPYVDSILAADNYAQGVSGGSTGSSAYKNALWEKSKGFTIRLFSRASHAMAELFYSAWVEAGRPLISAQGVQTRLLETMSVEIFPNPFREKLSIRLDLRKELDLVLQVRNAEGKVLDTITNGPLSAGIHDYAWIPRNAASGVYFFVLLTAEGEKLVRKIMLTE
jgi:hypothetical protein